MRPCYRLIQQPGDCKALDKGEWVEGGEDKFCEMKKETSMIEIHRNYFSSRVFPNHIADEGIVNAFIDLIRDLPTPCDEEYNTSAEYSRISFYPAMSWKGYLFDKNVSDALIKLAAEINDGMKRLYDKGKSDGKNLLMQLNNDEISTEQFLKK